MVVTVPILSTSARLAPNRSHGYAIDLETLINGLDQRKLLTSPARFSDHERNGCWYLARANGKLCVLSKAKFEEYGYTILKPDEMMARPEEIADDGDTPWCIGIDLRRNRLTMTD